MVSMESPGLHLWTRWMLACFVANFADLENLANLSYHLEIWLVLSLATRLSFPDHWELIPNACKEYSIRSKCTGCSDIWIEST